SVADRRTGAIRSRRTSRSDPSARPSLRLVPSDRRTSAKEGARLARIDLALLFSSAGFLTALGLVMVLSAGSVSAAQGYDGNSFWYFQRQLVYAAVGIAGAIVIARISPARWRAIGPVLLVSTSVLMLIAAHPGSGTSFYGALR